MAASIKSEGSKLSAMIDQKTKLQTCSQSDVAGQWVIVHLLEIMVAMKIHNRM